MVVDRSALENIRNNVLWDHVIYFQHLFIVRTYIVPLQETTRKRSQPHHEVIQEYHYTTTREKITILILHMTSDVCIQFYQYIIYYKFNKIVINIYTGT